MSVAVYCPTREEKIIPKRPVPALTRYCLVATQFHGKQELTLVRGRLFQLALHDLVMRWSHRNDIAVGQAVRILRCTEVSI